MTPAFDKEIHRIASELSGKNILFLAHAHPDADTLSSAFVLSRIFSKIGKGTRTQFGLSEKPHPHMREFLQSIGAKPKLIQSLKEFDAIVCVDFRSPSHAGELSQKLIAFSGKIIIIDHHHLSSNEFHARAQKLIIPNTVATAQLVYELGSLLLHLFSKEEARALASGIVVDSARFASANEETFAAMFHLLHTAAISYESLLAETLSDPSFPERVMVLNGLKNIHYLSAGDYILALAKAPFTSSAMANAMVQLGADVGIGYYSHASTMYFSIRVSARAHSELKLDAMKIILPFAKSHEGNAGGHARAASISIPDYFSESIVEELFTRQLLALVRKKVGKAFLTKH